MGRIVSMLLLIFYLVGPVLEKEIVRSKVVLQAVAPINKYATNRHNSDFPTAANERIQNYNKSYSALKRSDDGDKGSTVSSVLTAASPCLPSKHSPLRHADLSNAL